MKNKEIFTKNNMIDLIPIAKKMKTKEKQLKRNLFKSIDKLHQNQQPLMGSKEFSKSYKGENALKRSAITNGEMESSPALIKGSPADKIKKELCCRCKKNKATIDFCNSVLDFSHGFVERICKECYDKIRNSNAWFIEGKKIGYENAKQEFIEDEIKFLNDLKDMFPKVLLSPWVYIYEEIETKLNDLDIIKKSLGEEE